MDTVVFDGELDLITSESGEFGIVTVIRQGVLPAYTGQTRVTPSVVTEKVLQTANKTVFQNITVEKVPVVYTSNLYDGKTVIIG